MPLYDFKCTSGHKFERMVKLADFEVPQNCACTAPASRMISKPMFSVEQVGYDCPVTSKWIGSKREHEDNLRRQDCRVYEPGERENLVKTKAAEEAAFDASIEATVEKSFEALPSEKKERLASELSSGVDVAVERL